MTSQTNARKAPVTHKDLTMLYLVNGGGEKGTNKIAEKLVGHTDAVGTIEKILKTMRANDQPVAALVALRDKFAEAQGNGVKGRKPVAVGVIRSYSVQQLADKDDLFIRLPLNTLGVKKGDKVEVSFEAGQIKVTPVKDEVAALLAKIATLEGKTSAQEEEDKDGYAEANDDSDEEDSDEEDEG